MTDAVQNPALSAWIRLLKVHNLVFRQARLNLAGYCTMAQFDVIAQLAREPKGTTQSELSRHLLVTAGNVTGLIDRMERAGLVERKEDSNDRRITRVRLSAKGRRLAKRVIPRHSKDIQTAFGALQENEILKLRSFLEKVIDGLEKK
jgi:DNA-binding MarR family transcriptional regulator